MHSGFTFNKISTTTLTLFLAGIVNGLVSAQSTDSHILFFGNDRSYPTYTQWVGLDDFIASQPSENVLYRVVGHADSKGSLEENDQLAQERAQVVVRHLIEHGIDPVNVRFSSNGELKPDRFGENEQALSANRRVEVFVEHEAIPATATSFVVADLASTGCLVKPPLPSSQLPIERFQFPADERQEIRVSSGTILFIPAQAFVDLDGQLAEGSIDLTYEEFHDRAEVFLSGIPMKFSSQGVELPMETYGMFRVLARNKNGRLDLAPGKNIDLEFVSNSSNSDVNFYHLDSRYGKWVELGKAELMSANADATGSGYLSPAAENYLHLISGTQSVNRDDKNLEQRFHSSDYVCENQSAKKLRSLRDGDLREKRAYKKAMKTLPEFKLKIQPVKSGEDRNWVKFILNDSNLKGNKNRAWRTAFKSHVWQYDGSMNRNEFIQKFHHRAFQDLLITLDEASDQVVLEIKDLDGIASIPLMKVTKGELDLDMFRQVYDEMLDAGTKRMLAKRESHFEKRFKVYQGQLKLRNRRLKKEADRAFALAQNRWERDLEWAWEESMGLMSPSESELTFSDWHSHCAFQAKKEKRQTEIRFASNATVVRSLSIGTCGIYNCDQLKNLVSPVQANANFVANGKVVDWYEAFVFDENLNSYLKHSAKDSETISFDPEALLGLVVIDMSGNHFYLQKEDVMAMNHGGKPLRIMNVEPLSSQSDVDDIRQLLSMGF
jgi:hypothetical protein